MTLDLAQARGYMVDRQLRTVDVTNAALLDAFAALPRENFVPEPARQLAYLDRDVALDAAGSRFLLAPGPLARLIQLLAPGARDRALIVGAGTGYGAAIVARLAKEVVALECDAGLVAMADQAARASRSAPVTFVTGPLEQGAPARAPYDSILFEGSVDQVPGVIADQLAEGGRMAAVVGRGRTAQARLFVREGGLVSSRVMFDAALPPLPGFQSAESFAFSL